MPLGLMVAWGGGLEPSPGLTMREGSVEVLFAWVEGISGLPWIVARTGLVLRV